MAGSLRIDDITDDDLKKIELGSPSGGAISIDSLSDDDIAKMTSPVAGESGGTFGGDLMRQFVSGATFGLDDELFGAMPGSSIEGERRRKQKFEESNPWTSFLTKVAGGVAGTFVPASWVARLGALGNAARVAYPLMNAGKIAKAGALGALHEGGKVGAKAALWQSFGDNEGNVLERAGDLVNPVKSLPAAMGGYAIGAPFGYAGRGLYNIANDANTVRNVGLGAEANSLSRLREAMDNQGRTMADVVGETFARGGPQRLTVDARRAVAEAYADAIGGGQNAATARQNALMAYQATSPTHNGRPLAQSTMQRHVDDIIRNLDDDFAGPGAPMLAAERLSGLNRPISGAMRSLTQSLANKPDSRSILSQVVEPRQEQALGRVRDLLTNTIGDREYSGFVRDLTRRSQEAMGQGYGRAMAQAERFDLAPVIQRHVQHAMREGGEAHRALRSAIDDVGDWYTRMQSIEGLTPAEFLNSYKQMRSALSTQIENARNGGLLGTGKDRDVARVLTRLKRDMDAAAIRPRGNREWWRVNRMSAEAFDIQKAADRGIKLNLQKGSSTQEARDWYRDATLPEREAFQRGIARQLFDKLPRESTHDISKGYMAGGMDETEEGMRGIVTLILGDDAPAFFDRMMRERIALSTFNLNRGSQTSALEREAGKNSKLQGALQVLRYGVDPIGLVNRMSEYAAERAGAASDRALARRISSTDLPAFLRLIRELERAQRTPPRQLSTAFERLPDALASQAPGLYQER